jgi:hypothetical protein
MPVIWMPGQWVTAALRTGDRPAALSRGTSHWAHRFFGSEIENKSQWAGQVHSTPCSDTRLRPMSEEIHRLLLTELTLAAVQSQVIGIQPFEHRLQPLQVLLESRTIKPEVINVARHTMTLQVTQNFRHPLLKLTELGIGQPPGSSHIFNERQQFPAKRRF